MKLIPFCILLLVLYAVATPGRAEEEAGREVTTGEEEELPELLPEQTIPWHESLLELPAWMEQEIDEIKVRTRPANQGGGLFPGEVWPTLPEPALDPLLWNTATGSEIAQTILAEAPVPLSPELMKLYEAVQPERVFLDPQNLVQGRSADMESLVQRWLNDQCPFRTKVMIFGRGQQLPSDLDPQSLRRQWFGESDDSLLVLYFLDEPQRTLSIFSQEACSIYSERALRATGEAAVNEASRVPGSLEQLERFCYKMSVRLHWLKPLSPEKALLTSTSVPGSRFQWLKPLLWFTATTTALGGFCLLVQMGLRRHRAAERGAGPVLFPEFDSTPRLGAPHAGGFSAVINFSPLQRPEAGISAALQ